VSNQLTEDRWGRTHPLGTLGLGCRTRACILCHPLNQIDAANARAPSHRLGRPPPGANRGHGAAPPVIGSGSCRTIPGIAMPEMGVGEQEARDIAAYLYTLQ
jgi:hypothetical protein